VTGDNTVDAPKEQPRELSRTTWSSSGHVYCPRALRILRWNSARVLLVGAAGLFWWLGCEYVHRFGRYSPPSEGMPKASQAVVSNNKAALLQLPVNLEGTAVVYPQVVAALVRAEGEFRTGLSLNEMASVLKVDPQTIAKRGSRNEIDPEAVLFSALTGRLAERAKARSRRMRETEYPDTRPALVEPDEWLTVDVPFSLNVLRHPNQEQKMILDAISRSARGLMREPGAKANAVPLPFLHAGRQLQPSEFAAGYLPLEPLPVDHGADEKPSSEL
jgi:hypothetical protein